MSDVFSVFNTYDGTTQKAADGELLVFHTGPGAALVIEWLVDIDAATWDAGAPQVSDAGGVTFGTTGKGPGVAPSTFHLIVPVQPSVLPGADTAVINGGITIMGGSVGADRLGLKLLYNAPIAGGGDITLPDDTIDLQVDMTLRSFASRMLPRMQGFKVGDDIKFGVVPRRGGALVDSGIDSITLAMRPVGKYLGDPLEFTTDDSITTVGSDPNKYYELDVKLDDDALKAWFAQANGQNNAGTEGAPATDKLVVACELQFAEGDVVTTSDTFNLTLFQSIAVPNS